MSILRPPTVAEIWAAEKRIRPHVFRTPLRPAAALGESNGAPVLLKLENWQPTGSFKVRGAFNLLSQLSAAELERGLVAASAGNHGSAVGYAARQLRLPNVHIFVPGTAPRTKIDKMKRFGVNVHAVGTTYDDAHHAAAAYEEEHGATFVHAYDDARTAAGAGTIALELLEDAPDVEMVVVPVGGGGLISGIAAALHALAPRVTVVAVQPDTTPALRDSLRDNVCYEEYTAAPTICDGLAGGIGKLVFDVARRGWIHRVLVVREESVRRAVAQFARTEQLMVEGSGAVGAAALAEFPDEFRGKKTALIVSGANLDAGRLVEILNEVREG